MAIRGAPAIGCAAAYGMALSVRAAPSLFQANRALKKAATTLEAARPTAVNLAWAVHRMLDFALSLRNLSSLPSFSAQLKREACRIHEEDKAGNLRMGERGARLFPDRCVILTHCNTGALATSIHGTALGVIRTAHALGKVKKVFVDETRPYLQGSRLTAWELQKDKIPYEIITDSMAGHFMKLGEVDAVIVGADRVAANGDVANKIGTYSLAVLAGHHGIPFYVAAPVSTIDFSIRHGRQIPIEERSSGEVLQIGRSPIAPHGARARHPAFDVTPARYVTALITEKGIVRSPSLKTMRVFRRRLS
jgi:methylthioribose-1-phosphate isomerase